MTTRSIAALLVGLVAGCAAPPQTLPENRVGPAATEPGDPPAIKTVYARFADASGLVPGTEVTVSGIVVGEVADIEIVDGSCRRCARVAMRLRRDLELLISATAYKRATSTLGAFYIELDLGNAPATNLEATRIEDGGEIERVVETRSVDEILERLDQ